MSHPISQLFLSVQLCVQVFLLFRCCSVSEEEWAGKGGVLDPGLLGGLQFCPMVTLEGFYGQGGVEGGTVVIGCLQLGGDGLAEAADIA